MAGNEILRPFIRKFGQAESNTGLLQTNYDLNREHNAKWHKGNIPPNRSGVQQTWTKDGFVKSTVSRFSRGHLTGGPSLGPGFKKPMPGGVKRAGQGLGGTFKKTRSGGYRSGPKLGLGTAKYGRRRMGFMPQPYGYGRIGTGRRTGGQRLPLGHGEVKNHDTGLSPTVLTAPTDWAGAEVNPSATTPLNGVPQGDSEVERIGRSLREVSLLVKGTIILPAQTSQTAADTTPEIFIAVVRDTQCNGAAPNSEDCFKLPLADAALACNPFRNLAFGPRFKVLKIMKFRMPMPTIAWNGTTIEQGGVHRDFSCFLKLNNHKTTFSGALATFASMQNDAISIFAVANNISTGPKISYAIRLRYTDS